MTRLYRQKHRPQRVTLINLCAHFNNLDYTHSNPPPPAKPIILSLTPFVQQSGFGHGLFAAGCFHQKPHPHIERR